MQSFTKKFGFSAGILFLSLAPGLAYADPIPSCEAEFLQHKQPTQTLPEHSDKVLAYTGLALAAAYPVGGLPFGLGLEGYVGIRKLWRYFNVSRDQKHSASLLSAARSGDLEGKAFARFFRRISKEAPDATEARVRQILNEGVASKKYCGQRHQLWSFEQIQDDVLAALMKDRTDAEQAVKKAGEDKEKAQKLAMFAKIRSDEEAKAAAQKVAFEQAKASQDAKIEELEKQNSELQAKLDKMGEMMGQLMAQIKAQSVATNTDKPATPEAAPAAAPAPAASGAASAAGEAPAAPPATPANPPAPGQSG